jgi:PsbP-like protein
MNKKAFLGLLVVVVTLVVATAGCTSSTNPSSASPSPSASAVPLNITGYANYANSTAGVRLQYPSGWNVTEGGSSTRVVKLSSDSGSNVIISKERYTGSLESYKDNAISGVLNITGFNYTLVSTEKTTLAGLPAYNTTFTATYLGQNAKQVVSITGKDNYYYLLTFTSTSEEWNMDQNYFSNIFNSFAITG